jgi:hypothetical protein
MFVLAQQTGFGLPANLDADSDAQAGVVAVA